MGKDLISFSKESIYADQKVTVLGLLKDGKDAVSATAAVKTESNVKQVVTGDNGQTVSSPTSDSKDKAAEKAEKRRRKSKEEAVGTGRMRGTAAAGAGPYGDGGRLESRINGEYMVKA